MKLRVVKIVLLLLCLAGLLWLVFGERPKDTAEPIARAEVARAVALLKGSSAECGERQGASHFTEEEQANWYVKYADFLYEQGLWDETETSATSACLEGEYTYAELWGLLERAQCSTDLTSREANEKLGGQPVDSELWWQAWSELRACLDTTGAVCEENAVIYGTPESLADLPAWTAATSLGELGFEGMKLSQYQDREVQIWIRDQEILRVGQVLRDEVCYENVLITSFETSGTGSRLEFLLEGWSKGYALEGQVLAEAYELVLADVTVSAGRVTQVDLKRESITGKVLAIKEEAIEIQGYGEVPRSAQMKVYRTYGELAVQSVEDIHLGSDAQRFIVAQGEICGVLTERAALATDIRVLLKTNGFAGTVHDRVEVTGDRAFSVNYGDRTDYYQAGQTVAWTPGDACFAAGRVTITPENGGKLQVLTLERACGTPAYSGTLELLAVDGGLVLINEVLLEEYLTLVLPSEMPESYGLEALKAQAVCARSYAYRQMAGKAYSDYGAHVDDSTSFQVYNNSAASELARQAVEETYGQVLTYEGQVITTYYFSTSCGHTTDGAVWGGDPAAAPYLEGRWMQAGEPELDLTDEATFRAFITRTDEAAYEAGFPWYRWQVTISLQELNDQINAYLAAAGANPTPTLLAKQEDGTFAPGTISGIGTLKTIQVTERGIGGVAKTLEIEGSSGTVQVLRQNTIRTILGGPEHVYQRNGDTYQSRNSLLPSGYIFLEPQYTGDLLTGYTIYGGGSGHGVGMSQNAACYLGRIGKNYDEILATFYKDCILARLY